MYSIYRLYGLSVEGFGFTWPGVLQRAGMPSAEGSPAAIIPCRFCVGHGFV